MCGNNNNNNNNNNTSVRFELTKPYLKPGVARISIAVGDVGDVDSRAAAGEGYRRSITSKDHTPRGRC